MPSYLDNPNSSFFSGADAGGAVDDDAFLSHPKQGSGGYMFPTAARPQNPAGDALERRREQLLAERQRIEQSTLDSSSRSVTLLAESEQVGLQTAGELVQQREQLENSERRLDDINSTLNVSQRHINNIKSVFSSLRSYFGNRNAAASQQQAAAGDDDKPAAAAVDDSRLGRAMQRSDDAVAAAPPRPHPTLEARGLAELQCDSAGSNDDPYDKLDAKLNSNLDDMCAGLSRLRGLADGMQVEISDQNQMLDRITDKTERADLRIGTQNKQMNRILKN